MIEVVNPPKGIPKNQPYVSIDVNGKLIVNNGFVHIEMMLSLYELLNSAADALRAMNNVPRETKGGRHEPIAK